MPATRAKMLILVLAGAGAAGIAYLFWPVRDHQVGVRTTHLDEIMPVWQAREVHSTHVAAPPERVFDAIRAVTAREIFLFRTLTAIRRLGLPGRESILNPPPDAPILDVATRTGFRYLVDDPPREMVIGIPVAARTDAAMNFLVTAETGGSRVTTETRVYSSTPSAGRQFAVYWRVIRPGSGIIRQMWLRAIRRRAEGEWRPSSSKR